MEDKIVAVSEALNKACLKEYESTWNYDVTRRFAQAALDAVALPSTETNIRIEALRAAAVVVAPTWAELMRAGMASDMDPEKAGHNGTATLRVAREFAKWLETGE